MKKKWSGLAQYIAITRKGYRDKKWFEKGVEQHPVLHWTKDVMMKEDACGIRSGCCSTPKINQLER